MPPYKFLRFVRPITIFGVVAFAIGVCYWLLEREQQIPDAIPELSCQIRYLSQEERYRLASNLFDIGEIDVPFPLDELDNPVLHFGRWAVVRLENRSKNTINLYSLVGPWRGDPEFRKFELDTALNIRSGKALMSYPNERKKKYLLYMLEREPTALTVREGFIVKQEVQGPDGNLIEVSPSYSITLPEPHVPSPEEIHSEKLFVLKLEPGESVELPISILGELSRLLPPVSDELIAMQRKIPGGIVEVKSGTYTVRALVSYAEAPSGEKKTVTSEPVTITITEAQLKAAENYRVAESKVNNP